MEFTATDHDLRVDYKLSGKIYNEHPKDIEAARDAKPHHPVTADPFDSEVILKGKTWVLPAGAEVIRKVVLST